MKKLIGSLTVALAVMLVTIVANAEQIEELTSRDYAKIDTAFKKYTQLIFIADKCSTWLRSKDTLNQDCQTYLENADKVTNELSAFSKGKRQQYFQQNPAARDLLVRAVYVLSDTETLLASKGFKGKRAQAEAESAIKNRDKPVRDMQDGRNKAVAELAKQQRQHAIEKERESLARYARGIEGARTCLEKLERYESQDALAQLLGVKKSNPFKTESDCQSYYYDSDFVNKWTRNASIPDAAYAQLTSESDKFRFAVDSGSKIVEAIKPRLEAFQKNPY